MLSDEEKKEFLMDGLSKTRRDHFRDGESVDVSLSMEEYLQWLTQMENWSPAPPPSEIKRYSRFLL
jgi:hypothetical protein